MLACIARRARQMRSIATDGVAWSVCVLVTTVSLAKTDEPIVMPFREQTRVGPQECIRWGHGSPNGNGTLSETCTRHHLDSGRVQTSPAGCN